METTSEHPVSKQDLENIDASKINKTDKNGAFTDKDGKSKNYKGAGESVNGPNFDKPSKGAEGDTSSTAGVFK
jgi:hypothetical protein